MTAPTYLPGDVAMVDNEPGVFCHMVNHDGSESRFFALLNGYVALVDDAHEISSVLGNVAGLAKDAIDADTATPAMPLAEAMDLFDRFWNANHKAVDRDWTLIGHSCDCGACYTCGIRYALRWTNDLLSNPALADHAERPNETASADIRRREGFPSS